MTPPNETSPDRGVEGGGHQGGDTPGVGLPGAGSAARPEAPGSQLGFGDVAAPGADAMAGQPPPPQLATDPAPPGQGGSNEGASSEAGAASMGGHPPETPQPPPPHASDVQASDSTGQPEMDADPEPGTDSEAAATVAATPDGDTPGPSAAPTALDVEVLVVTLEDVTRERDQFRDSAQRIQAEFENYKKQSQKRLDLDVERKSGRIIDALLPVLDACDGAMTHGSEQVAPIASALLDALSGQGLERIVPQDEPFDPEAHEAVMHDAAAADGPGFAVVTEVMRAGYRWQGRILRPAMVRVQG